MSDPGQPFSLPQLLSGSNHFFYNQTELSEMAGFAHPTLASTLNHNSIHMHSSPFALLSYQQALVRRVCLLPRRNRANSAMARMTKVIAIITTVRTFGSYQQECRSRSNDDRAYYPNTLLW